MSAVNVLSEVVPTRMKTAKINELIVHEIGTMKHVNLIILPHATILDGIAPVLPKLDD